MEARPTESLQCWWSMWLALQVAEGEREPPTSCNDSLGVMEAGVAGGGEEREPLGLLGLALQKIFPWLVQQHIQSCVYQSKYSVIKSRR